MTQPKCKSAAVAKVLTTANVAALQKRLPKGSGTTAKTPTTYHY
ncbi:hypothetical protein GCM10022254_61840 [Actinomadura meridiana]|uniref:Uncharacterized protein n=1 Tax=Actinomadura meridiana TaxID=559626 RepID=A0ABP8CIS7_9ACTN